MHHNFKPAKSGLFDQQIAREKHLRLVATYKANPTVKSDIMRMAYGSLQKTSAIANQLRLEGAYVFRAAAQHAQLRYSDRGDFTRCYRGGF